MDHNLLHGDKSADIREA